MGLEALVRAITSRSLPQADQDNTPNSLRGGRYGELYVLAHARKQHLLGDEGSYFVVNNNGAGVATAAAPTAFSDTAPLLTFQNTDSPSNPNAKRIHIDWIRLTETAAGTGATDLRLRAILDSTIPSGGTSLIPTNPNMDVSSRASVAVVRLLPVGIAQTGNSRVIVGTHVVIPTMTTPIAALSEVFLNLGGVEGTPYPLWNSAASANAFKAGYPWPMISIGPGQCFMLEFLLTGQSATSSWTAEAGMWER